MADRYLLESGSPDGYLLEDDSGVLLIETNYVRLHRAHVESLVEATASLRLHRAHVEALVSVGTIVSVGRATSTDTARVATSKQVITVGRAASSTAARSTNIGRSYIVGRTASTITARAAQLRVSTLVGRATETDTVRPPLGVTQRLTVGRAGVTATARSAIVRFSVGRTASSIATRKPAMRLVPLRVTETEAARAAGRRVPVGRAGETDTARSAIPAAGHVVVGRALEHDRARRIVGVVVNGSTQVITFEVIPGYSAVATDLVVTAMDKTLRRAPTSLPVSVYGAEPDETLTFKVDGVTMATADADSQGTVLQLSIPVTTDVGAVGSHTVTVESATKSGSDTFTIALAPVAVEVLRGADNDPVLIPEANQGSFYQWVFQDLMAGGLGSWIMPINPSGMTSPGFETNVEVQHSTSVETGQFHIWQVGQQPVEWQFSGYCPDQAFYEQLQAYAALTRRFYIIDHRNRAWKVAIVGLDMVARKRAIDETGAPQDWRHDYTVRAYIYEQTPGVPV